MLQLYKSYVGICRSSLINPIGILEYSNMCKVLIDLVFQIIWFDFVFLDPTTKEFSYSSVASVRENDEIL